MTRPRKERLDTKLAKEAGLSRNQAAALIMAGKVLIDERVTSKPGHLVDQAARLTYDLSERTVSRAAGKLAPGLDKWQLPVRGKVAVDVGASTGGFTQTLLKRGAVKVYAVDVGHGQLDWSLRNDDRVVVMERTDIRSVEDLPGAELATVDVSFISLRQVLPTIAELLPPASNVIALFKPQFEVGKATADKYQGVISDLEASTAARKELTDWVESRGWGVIAQQETAVTGTKGNHEHLLWLRTPGSA